MNQITQDALAISSGTLASLIGKTDYESVDAAQRSFVRFCERNEGKFESWVQAWKAFQEYEARKQAYEDRRQARYDRLLAAARKTQNEATHLVAQAHEMASYIPFGQPILVGHHSEKRDRAYRGRIDSKYRKGFELYERASELTSRAQAAGNNDAIFSDDPAAQEKLEDKIAKLEKRQELMKAANKLVKKNDLAGLITLGFSEEFSHQIIHGRPFCRRPGFQSYELTNNSANIRRLKERLETIKKHADDETTEKVICGIRVVDNVEEGRLQIFFRGKPEESVRSDLKSHGFRWSPTGGCWQAYRGSGATYWSEWIIKKYFEKGTE